MPCYLSELFTPCPPSLGRLLPRDISGPESLPTHSCQTPCFCPLSWPIPIYLQGIQPSDFSSLPKSTYAPILGFPKALKERLLLWDPPRPSQTPAPPREEFLQDPCVQRGMLQGFFFHYSALLSSYTNANPGEPMSQTRALKRQPPHACSQQAPKAKPS